MCKWQMHMHTNRHYTYKCVHVFIDEAHTNIAKGKLQLELFFKAVKIIRSKQLPHLIRTPNWSFDVLKYWGFK